MKNSIILLISISLFSCKKEDPVACIDVISDTYEVGDEINFSAACSKNGFSYNWDFSDGTSSEERSPKHIYTASGTYNVELKTYSEKKKKVDTDELAVIIKALPVNVKILSVELFYFPKVKPDQSAWDFGGSPDIRLSVIQGTTTYVEGFGVVQDAVFNQAYTFYSDFPVTLPYTGDFQIVILDQDGTTDELVGVIDFDPSKYSLTEPNYVDIIQSGSSIRLQLQWIY